ncbi:unnamed protein product [Orchesella dallaii]|uniref:Negative elongation factor E n=1 Tax=Orchesella dallaii TaxID=48710 RepID=A0ABP1R1I1_9HEXA
MSYSLYFPEQPTEEELMLHEKYAILRIKKRQVLEHEEAAKKLAEPPKLSKVSPVDAKERAKKLVLAGKVSLPPKPMQEKATFKRPSLVKKIPLSSKITGAKTVGGGTVPVAGGGTTSTFPIPKVFTFPQEQPLALPQLETSFLNVPKRGPTIYITAKDHALSEAMLKTVFGNFGVIDEIKLTHPHVAFVTFRNVENAERAITEMNGAVHNGIEYGVEFAWRQCQSRFSLGVGHSQNAVATDFSPSSSDKGIGNTNWDKQRELVVYEDDDDGELILT